MKKPIYLDYNATTPLDPRVFESMLPYFREEFGNSVSAAHSYGWNAEKAVEDARQQVADLLHCQAHEVFFTAGATESNNWVIRGLIDRLRRESPTQKIEFISSPIEHSSVIRSLRWAETQGVKVRFIDVNPKGELNLSQLKSAINENTRLMTFMWINNEIGVINPMKELAEIARGHKIYLHSDATQAIGKVPVDLKAIPIDLVSFSAHKIYGPKGIGALVIRSRDPKVQIDPLMYGGGHERGLRSGTVNVPSVVGLGTACKIISKNLTTESEKLLSLQKYFWDKLRSAFPEAHLNGPEIGLRAPNNLNVTFQNQKVPASFVDLAVSRGSACLSGLTSVSPVLKAIGVSENHADKTLRMSFGRWTTKEEIDQAVNLLRVNLH
jgi:cysteine desulfurase